MSGSETESGAKGGKHVVGIGRSVFGGDADGGSGGGTGGGGGGDGQNRDKDGRLIKWEDTVSKTTLGTAPNAPPAYDTGLELHHPIMSTLGMYGGELERERSVLSFFYQWH